METYPRVKYGKIQDSSLIHGIIHIIHCICGERIWEKGESSGTHVLSVFTEKTVSKVFSGKQERRYQSLKQETNSLNCCTSR